MYRISICFSDNERQPVYFESVPAGHTLLEFCLSKNIPLQHECGGVASCTTCSVQVIKGAEFLEPPSRREQQILAKKHKTAADLRLACQCVLLEGNGEVEIKGLDKIV